VLFCCLFYCLCRLKRDADQHSTADCKKTYIEPKWFFPSSATRLSSWDPWFSVPELFRVCFCRAYRLANSYHATADIDAGSRSFLHEMTNLKPEDVIQLEQVLGSVEMLLPKTVKPGFDRGQLDQAGASPYRPTNTGSSPSVI